MRGIIVLVACLTLAGCEKKEHGGGRTAEPPQDPCEMAFDQSLKCDKRDYSESEKKTAKREFVKICKDSEALLKAAKKCSGISDCKQAKTCWRAAMKD
jgi:hypothetical protein